MNIVDMLVKVPLIGSSTLKNDVATTFVLFFSRGANEKKSPVLNIKAEKIFQVTERLAQLYGNSQH
ncbi:MAG: hypothetical protein ACXW04_07280 [Methylobacter sp.]